MTSALKPPDTVGIKTVTVMFSLVVSTWAQVQRKQRPPTCLLPAKRIHAKGAGTFTALPRTWDSSNTGTKSFEHLLCNQYSCEFTTKLALLYTDSWSAVGS